MSLGEETYRVQGQEAVEQDQEAQLISKPNFPFLSRNSENYFSKFSVLIP